MDNSRKITRNVFLLRTYKLVKKSFRGEPARQVVTMRTFGLASAKKSQTP